MNGHSLFGLLGRYAHRRTLGYVEGLSAAGNEEIEGKARTYISEQQLISSGYSLPSYNCLRSWGY